MLFCSVLLWSTVIVTTIIIFSLMALTFRGECLRVAVAETSGEMYQDSLSLLGLPHQRKSPQKVSVTHIEHVFEI